MLSVGRSVEWVANKAAAFRQEWFPLAVGRSGHLWWIFLVAGLVIALAQGRWYGGLIAWSGSLGLLIGAAQVHGRRMGPWWLLALSHAMFVAGAITQARADAAGTSVLGLNLADLLYVLATGVFALGMIGFIRSRSSGAIPFIGLLDGAVVVLCTGLVGWWLFVQPTLDQAPARRALSDVSWARGVATAVRVDSGEWLKLPGVGSSGQGLANSIRAWLKR